MNLVESIFLENESKKHIDLRKWSNYCQDPWVENGSEVTISSLDKFDFIDVTFELLFLDADFYGYTPFNIEIHLTGGRKEIFEADPRLEENVFTIRSLHCVGGSVNLNIFSEQDVCPAEIGVVDDERHIICGFKSVRSQKAERLRSYSEIEAPSYFSGSKVESVCSSPVFIIGAYRSGTSSMTWTLGSHPNFIPFEESAFLRYCLCGAMAGFSSSSQSHRDICSELGLSIKDYLSAQFKSLDGYLKNAHLKHAERFFRLDEFQGKKINRNFIIKRTLACPVARSIDGTPENTYMATILSRICPSARFVYLIRNPLDVIRSMLFFEGNPYKSIENAVAMWCRMNAVAYRFYKSYHGSCIKVISEDFFNDFEYKLSEIFSFLAEPNFINAIYVSQQKVNSSRIPQGFSLEIEPDLRAGLTRMYADIINDEPYEKINWLGYNVDNEFEEKNDIINRFIDCLA